MNWLLAAEIVVGIIGGLWLSAFVVYAIRRLLHGPDVAEPIDSAFYAKYSARASKEGRFHRALVALDIMANVFAGGQEDETLSARSYRAKLEGKLWGRVMDTWLCLYQSQHGPKAAVGDLYRARNRVIYNTKVLGLS